MDAMTAAAAYYRGDRTFSVEAGAVTPPGRGEARIRVAYCGICGTDMHVYHGKMDACVGPNRIIGHEMSGTVEHPCLRARGFRRFSPIPPKVFHSHRRHRRPPSCRHGAATGVPRPRAAGDGGGGATDQARPPSG